MRGNAVQRFCQAQLDYLGRDENTGLSGRYGALINTHWLYNAENYSRHIAQFLTMVRKRDAQERMTPLSVCAVIRCCKEQQGKR